MCRLLVCLLGVWGVGVDLQNLTILFILLVMVFVCLNYGCKLPLVLTCF